MDLVQDRALDMADLQRNLGLYLWNTVGWDISYIHPADYESFKLVHLGRAFMSLAEQDSYLILRHDRNIYRVKPELFQSFTCPFGYGDIVETTTGTRRVGEIRDIIWHSEHRQWMFFIRVGTKKITKRYWQDDLRLVSIGEPLNF